MTFEFTHSKNTVSDIFGVFLYKCNVKGQIIIGVDTRKEILGTTLIIQAAERNSGPVIIYMYSAQQVL